MMERLALGVVFVFACLAGSLAIWHLAYELQVREIKNNKKLPTFFFRNYLPDALGIEYFKRVVKEDEVVTCYWITTAKDELIFHTCKQRSLYD